jgi:hypothetical protein
MFYYGVMTFIFVEYLLFFSFLIDGAVSSSDCIESNYRMTNKQLITKYVAGSDHVLLSDIILQFL